MEFNPSTHVRMGWGWISQGCYPKVMVRSSQGHSKVKSAQNDIVKTSWVNTTANMELIQNIKDPTRISKSANTLIDHIYVSKDLPIIQSIPIEYSVSDHYPVYAVIDLKNILAWCANDTHKTIHYRKYTHF